jgi:hypothetical protein
MRWLAILACAVLVSSCGLAARQEREQQMAAAVAAKDSGIAACKEQYADENRDFVLRNKCGFAAAQVIRPFVTYPDLFDQSWAKAALLAEQLQAKKITRVEANAQMTESQSQIVAEEQRRNLANRSVGAQESAAAAAWLATPSVVVVRR